MNKNFEDPMDEWFDIDADSETLEEQDSSSLTWDDEVIRETHRTVSIRALRAVLRGNSFRWTAGEAA